MKILYLAPDAVPAPKGASVRITRTVATLRELGHEVELLTPAPASGGDAPALSSDGLAGVAHTTVELPHENFLDRMLAFRAAARAWLDVREADLVQFRGIWEGMSALAWARERGVPCVFEAHGFPSIELPYHYPGLSAAPGLLEKLIREEGRLLAEASLLVTPSRTGARYLQMRAVSPSRIAVVPNCVDPDLFSPSPAPVSDEPPHRLVYQGTLAPWQGLETLLEALARHRGRAIELHVVGPARSGWRRALRQLARRCRVHHQVVLSRGAAQPDLVPVLRSAHVCVAPLSADPRNSVQGCSPLKLLEYMAVGRPILSTAIPPVEELLEHRRSAWLARAGSPAALADGIAWLLERPDEREALGLRAREDAVALFGPDRFARDTTAALERVSRME